MLERLRPCLGRQAAVAAAAGGAAGGGVDDGDDYGQACHSLCVWEEVGRGRATPDMYSVGQLEDRT